VEELHPALADWMIEEGYGKVLARKGLHIHRRELCVVAVLAVFHAPDQLRSHLRGALAVGVDPETVESVLVAVDEFLTPTAREAVHTQWEAVKDRFRGQTPRP
jgi:4-carboxymuconolactone decarboxylase